MGSLTYILRDENTAIGIPLQTVTIRIGPAFIVDADTHTFSDVTGKAGAYKITDSSVVRTGFYKAYVNGVEDESFGGPNGREIIRGSDMLLKSGGTMAGTLNMNDNRIINCASPVDDDDPVTLLYFLAYACLQTGFTMEGDIDMDGNDLLVAPTPANANSAAAKAWVLLQIASITVTPYQLGDRSRRVIANGTEVPGRDYLTAQQAMNSIPTSGANAISVTNPYKIYLEQGVANTNNAANLGNTFVITEDDIKDHMHFIGNGENTIVILFTDSGGLTKNVKFENCTVFLTGNDFTGTRTYNGIVLNCCRVYAFKSTIWNNCSMHNSLVFNANGFSSTLKGSGLYFGCGFCQSILLDTFTGLLPNTNGGWLTNPTMPVDPSSALP